MDDRIVNGRGRAWALSLALSGVLAAPFSGAQQPADYDELPDGPAATVATLYYSALSLPGVSDWTGADKTALLDAVTVRYKDRLIDRASSVSLDLTRRYVERLAESPLARDEPAVVRQACAQFGMMDGVCEAHRGYVRRALVLEEMLVQGQLSLDALEIELIGATRPKLSGGSAAR